MSRASMDQGSLLHLRKTSTSKDSDPGAHGPPSLGMPHRRMSRIDNQYMGTGLNNRRMSTFRRPSNASYRTDNSSQRPPVKLANTYVMEPKQDEHFNSSFVGKVLNGILESFLVGEEYDSKASGIMAKNLTDVIKNRMKELHLPRYKFVIHVVIAQNSGQSMQIASRCVWSTATDNHASARFENSSLAAVANVYGCYFE